MIPEDALAAARAAAAEMRAEGAYAQAVESRPGPPSPETWRGLLWHWAFVDPDLSEVRSIRRYGAPITALKRVLLRLLAQYHALLTTEQARFNVVLLGEVRALERRVGELERALAAATAGHDGQSRRDPGA